MKTLLFDLTSLDAPARRRGVGRYLRELAEGFAALPREAFGELRLLGLTHLNWDGSFRVVEDLTSFRGSPEMPFPVAADHYRWAYKRRIGMWKALRKLGADAVHLGDPHATPLLMGLTRCKKIITCHDLLPLKFPERYLGAMDGGQWMGRTIERRRYRTADLIIAISDATLHDVEGFIGVAPKRLVRIYNGIGLEKWGAPPTSDPAAIVARFGLGARPFALHVGGCDWHKNIQGVMNGIAAARALGVDLELAWAGYLKPAQLDDVKSKALRAGVEAHVRFLGYVDDPDLAVLYRAALAHLLVSHAEGFGLTLVEAFAAGCPVVTTNGGSLAEIGNDACLRVDPDDGAAIGAALARLASDAALRDDLVRRGRERAPTFSRDVQAKAMVRAYRELLGV